VGTSWRGRKLEDVHQGRVHRDHGPADSARRAVHLLEAGRTREGGRLGWSTRNSIALLVGAAFAVAVIGAVIGLLWS
jgi:hypothetical protein